MKYLMYSKLSVLPDSKRRFSLSYHGLSEEKNHRNYGNLYV